MGTDAALDQRLRFLEAQLEAPKIHAQVWFWGWLSVYAGSAGIQGLRLGLVDGAELDATAQRADLTVTIVRSVLAFANHLLFYRLKARYGAEPMQEIEGEDRAAKLARLAAGEEALVSYAAESRRRYSWVRHALAVAVNLAGFFITWQGYNDLRQALLTTGIGLTLGEIIIWSQPWQPVGALEEYRARYGGP